ncbi:Dabb family protein [Okibacterium endophyticum]
MTIRHIVIWKLAAADAATKAEHTAEIERRFNELVPEITEIQSLRISGNVAYHNVNADVVLIADYENVDALERYQAHPRHHEVAAFVRSVVSERSSIDITL